MTTADRRSILFVCTGNTCRSPMAEALWNTFDTSVRARSAGVAAWPGQPAQQLAARAVERFGADLSGHRARDLESVAEDPVLVLAMTRNQAQEICRLRPEWTDRVVTLGEYAGTGEDIGDPLGLGMEAYARVAERLRDLLRKVRERLDAAGEPTERTQRRDTVRIAVGADHAGWPLKEPLVAFLIDRGWDVEDFGTFGPESVDYPDYAAKVAEAVARGDVDRGLLICGSGQGMCMTANKVDGVRAALAHDVVSARLSREHNDANVLTMGARFIAPGLAEEVLSVWLDTPFEGGRHLRRIEKIQEVERHGL